MNEESVPRKTALSCFRCFFGFADQLPCRIILGSFFGCASFSALFSSVQFLHDFDFPAGKTAFFGSSICLFQFDLVSFEFMTGWSRFRLFAAFALVFGKIVIGRQCLSFRTDRAFSIFVTNCLHFAQNRSFCSFRLISSFCDQWPSFRLFAAFSLVRWKFSGIVS